MKSDAKDTKRQRKLRRGPNAAVMYSLKMGKPSNICGDVYVGRAPEYININAGTPNIPDWRKRQKGVPMVNASFWENCEF